MWKRLAHLTKGLELLKALPDTPERAQQELIIQLALGTPLMAVKGFAAPEVEKTYARALELCQQMGETPQLFSRTVWTRIFYHDAGGAQTARSWQSSSSSGPACSRPRSLLDAQSALGHIVSPWRI